MTPAVRWIETLGRFACGGRGPPPPEDAPAGFDVVFEAVGRALT